MGSDITGWAGMARAGWSVLEHYERDGNEYVIAVRDRVAARASLTPRERQVLAVRQQGHSNKSAAHELGLSSSTVRVLLARGLKKLRVRTLAELAERGR